MQTFELLIDENDNSTLEVDAVALVGSPATKVNWFAFSTNPIVPAKINLTEGLIFGVAMVPDMPIYRQDEDGSEYNVKFSAATVKSIALKFFKKHFNLNSNIDHDPSQKVQGVTFYQSVIKDSTKGITVMDDGHPDGTWYLGAKVDNADVKARIESGEIKGFSVEGLFKYKKVAMSDEQRLEKIKLLLSEINDLS